MLIDDKFLRINKQEKEQITVTLVATTTTQKCQTHLIGRVAQLQSAAWLVFLILEMSSYPCVVRNSFSVSYIHGQSFYFSYIFVVFFTNMENCRCVTSSYKSITLRNKRVTMLQVSAIEKHRHPLLLPVTLTFM